MTVETNAEWSAIDFLRRNVIREKGYTKTFVDAIEEVTLLAERTQELERKLKLSEGEKGIKTELNNAAVRIIEEKDTENARLRKAIKQSLEKHKWNNEESAQILEKALAGETNGQRKA